MLTRAFDWFESWLFPNIVTRQELEDLRKDLSKLTKAVANIKPDRFNWSKLKAELLEHEESCTKKFEHYEKQFSDHAKTCQHVFNEACAVRDSIHDLKMRVK